MSLSSFRFLPASLYLYPQTPRDLVVIINCIFTSITMLSRSLWARQVAPLRRQVVAAPFAARRSVTTDAASAHAENIPEVISLFL